MMAAAGRESHRSTSAERTLLSPPGRESEEGAERSRADDESIFGGDPVGCGAAGLEAGVGTVEAPRAKKSSKRGRRKNKSSPGGPSEVAATTAAAAGGDVPATISAASSEGEKGGEALDAPPAGSPVPVAWEDDGLDRDGTESAPTRPTNTPATRERSQQMYEAHRQTQVS